MGIALDKSNTVNLSKNQVVNLSKKAPGMKNIIIGLGWDEAKQTSNNNKGFFGKLFGTSESPTESIDCDAFAVMLENGKLKTSGDVVYFGNLNHRSSSIVHTGDNLTGEGEGDDEQLIIKTDLIPKNIDKVILAVNVYKGRSKGQHFGKIENAFIHLIDQDRSSEVCRYDLSNGAYNGYITVIFGELYKESDGSWNFRAVGEGDTAESISAFTSKYC